MPSQAQIVGHATLVASRWRKRGASVDRVNRYLGRVDAIRTRYAARAGERLPTLYVQTRMVGGYIRRFLTTWTGLAVAQLEETGKARAFNCELTCYATVIEGRRYSGRGHGPGMYLNMRPGKVVSR